MLDVHAPHESVHGWRDFFVHLATITIGLLIALGLEGCVEWMHHRHLVQEVEVSLHDEIGTTRRPFQDPASTFRSNRRILAKDVEVLKEIIARHKQPPRRAAWKSIFIFRGFNNVSWQTAQTTGAFSYMPYARAQRVLRYLQHAGVKSTWHSTRRRGTQLSACGSILESKRRRPCPGRRRSEANQAAY